MGLIDAESHKVVARLPFKSQPWDVVFDPRQAFQSQTGTAWAVGGAAAGGTLARGPRLVNSK